MKKHFWDKFLAFFIIALAFTVGYHIGKGKETVKREAYEVRIATLKVKGEIREGAIVAVDGKYEATLFSHNESSITLTVDGEMTDAGFFAFGAKYLSCNQPIVIIGDSLYIEGRILAIYTAQDPTLHKIQPQRRKNVQFFSNFFVKSIDFYFFV